MLLKKGSQGEDVKKIQTKLGLPADGIFGPKTEEVVKNWQKEHGLINDGVVGRNTWEKMFPVESTQTPVAPIVVNSGDLKFENLKDYIPDNVLAQIPETITKFNINTPLRLAHFLSQCAHESGKFKITEENLNYSADGLLKTFGKYFPNRVLAEQYQRQPEKIASRVYGSRMGNGDENSKEGFKYKGAGYIQLTGKENYKAFGESIGVDLISHPELVSTKYPLLSAAWFFQRCLKKCDAGATRDVVTSVTKCVNGGTNGLEDRIHYFNQFYKLLS